MEKERIENSFRIELNEGTINLVYGSHSDPQKFPEELEDRVTESDAIVFEFTSNIENPRNYLNSPVDTLKDILGKPQYQEVYLERWKTGKPMYIVDATLDLKNERQTNDFLRMAEPLLGLGAAAAITMSEAIKLWEKRKNKKTTEHVQKSTRRKILKGIAGLGLAWSMSQPIATNAQGVSYKAEAGHEATAQLQKFSQTIHPELDESVVKYRNLLMAYKLIKLLEQEKIKDATMIVGLAHVGIEEILIDYQEGRLTLSDMEAALKEINSTIQSPVFHTVGKYYWDKNTKKWSIGSFEIPELK